MNRRSFFQILTGLVAFLLPTQNGVKMLPIATLRGEDRRGEDDLTALVHDIHQNGLVNPILVRDGQVIDGMRRLRACQILGRSHVPCREI